MFKNLKLCKILYDTETYYYYIDTIFEATYSYMRKSVHGHIAEVILCLRIDFLK